MKVLATLLVIAVILGPRAAAAQAVESRSQGPYVFGSVGKGGFAGIDSGAPEFGGWMFGLGGGYEVRGGWFMEGVVDQLTSYTSDTSGDHGNVTALLGRVGHRWGHGNSVFRPYLAFAIGTARDRWVNDYGIDRTANGTVIGAVLGGDVRAGNRFFVRPEVSLMGGMAEAFWRGSVGVGFRF